MTEANKVDVPYPQYSALTVNDVNDVFICCHRNFKMIKIGMLTSHPNSTHIMSLTTTHQYYMLHNQYVMKGTFVNDCDDNVSYITVDI